MQGFLVLLVGELGANLFDQRAGRKADRREGYGGLFWLWLWESYVL